MAYFRRGLRRAGYGVPGFGRLPEPAVPLRTLSNAGKPDAETVAVLPPAASKKK